MKKFALKYKWLIGGAGSLLLAVFVLAGLMLTVWGAPDKGDYKYFKAQLDQAAAVYNRADSVMVDYYNTAIWADSSDQQEDPVELKQTRQKFAQLIDKHLNMVEELEGLKALNDAQVRAKYQKFVDQQKRYAEQLKQYVRIAGLVYQIENFKCGDANYAAVASEVSVTKQQNAAKFYSQFLQVYRQNTKDCVAALQELKSLGNPDLTYYAETYIDYVRLFTNALKQFKQLETGDASSVSKLLKTGQIKSQIRQANQELKKAKDAYAEAINHVTEAHNSLTDESVLPELFDLLERRIKTDAK